ncbi:MAG TPA: NFACT RNA binding domain-containing protein [Candidatus Elarobacter sp.]|jgi:predicted ribosome quality control (RQC) complex YloA/Tae2 family protein|nr:NFACT RNA binding domain-containing protein [Candidatus Elarobacter sp.]
MTTDWILICRAGEELERALRGARVTDAGLLDDGRVALTFGGLRKRGPATLAVDAFGSPPVVTLDDAELAVAVDPGWLRSAGTTLRGMRLTSVRARRGDRVLVLTFGTASRFGVESESRLVLELVPRYGNVVLLRDRLVVAAAKQFSPAENEARSVQVGLPYEPPPLPQPSLDFAAFTRALEAATDAKARTRALGGYLPELPRLLAASVVAQSEARSWPSTTQLATWLEERARQVLAEAESSEPATRDVDVYRDAEGRIVAAHIVPLAQYASLAHETVPSLLDVFAEARSAALHSQRGDATERRRAALLARIAKRARATGDEFAAVAARIADAGARDRLRESGDALFTHAHEIPPGATSYVPPTNPELTIALDPDLDAKENAQRYYSRYRKAADALPHLERRRELLAARRDALDVLAFEAERADAPTLPELEADLDVLEGRPPQRAPQSAAKRRAPLRLERPSGARIYVGRSPRENAEVTFRIARPDDLWFHARGIPGSHVVLQAPPGGAPHDDDLAAAADLAAAHSKAKHAPRVEIDYTERKHVRKQRDAAPGLVWYTNARTRVGRPENGNGTA